MDNKDKQIQELSYENIKFREHIERQEGENKRLLSIMEQAESALKQFTRGNFYLAIENNTWSNYRHMSDAPWIIADEALKAIRGK